jgi:hypothetical protein
MLKREQAALAATGAFDVLINAMGGREHVQVL